MIFEGDAKQMRESIERMLEDIPEDASLYYGHEYAENNLRFALWVDPQNEAVQAKLAQVEDTLQNHQAAIPGILGNEIEYNPFIRSGTQEMLRKTEMENKVDSLDQLRKWKNNNLHKKSEEYKLYEKNKNIQTKPDEFKKAD